MRVMMIADGTKTSHRPVASIAAAQNLGRYSVRSLRLRRDTKRTSAWSPMFIQAIQTSVHPEGITGGGSPLALARSRARSAVFAPWSAVTADANPMTGAAAATATQNASLNSCAAIGLVCSASCIQVKVCEPLARHVTRAREDVSLDLFRVRSPWRADLRAPSQVAMPPVLSGSGRRSPRSTTSSGTRRARPSNP